MEPNNGQNKKNTPTMVVIITTIICLIIMICSLIFFLKHDGLPDTINGDDPSDTGQYIAFDKED